MSKIDFNPSTFSSRLTDLNAALQKKDKWVNDGLEVVNKENGFVRFIKIIFLPLARFFGADPFTHVRANAVALVLFAEFQKHEAQLSAEDKKTAYKVLDQLNAKTKNKYDIILMVLMPSVNKTFDGDIGTTIADYIDLGFKGTQQVGSSIPTPPSGNFNLFQTRDTQGSEAKTEKEADTSFFKSALNDKALKSKEAKAISKYDNPMVIGAAPMALHRLKSDVEEFIEAIDNADDFSDDELLIDLDLQASHDIDSHPILADYHKEYLSLSEQERIVWAKNTIDYLTDHTLVALQSVTKNLHAGKKDNVKSMQEHNALVTQIQKQKELETTLAKKEELRKEIALDLSTTTGKNKFSWNVLIGKYKPLHENPEDKYKLTPRDYIAEYQRVIDWINTGDLSDTPMLERHDLLKRIASDWKSIID